MKTHLEKIMITLCVSIFLGMAIPDGGDCVRIFGTFELKNGAAIKGYIHSDRIDFENARKDFKRFLHYSTADVKLQDTILVYDQIDTLKSIGIKTYSANCDYFFFACPAEKVTKIGFEDWQTGKMIHESPCEMCAQKEYLYSSGGADLITELSTYEIKRLSGTESLNNCIISQNEVTTIHLISLKNDYSKEQLEELYRKLSEHHDYHQLKEALRKLGIAMFRLYAMR